MPTLNSNNDSNSGVPAINMVITDQNSGKLSASWYWKLYEIMHAVYKIVILFDTAIDSIILTARLPHLLQPFLSTKVVKFSGTR